MDFIVGKEPTKKELEEGMERVRKELDKGKKIQTPWWVSLCVWAILLVFLFPLFVYLCFTYPTQSFVFCLIFFVVSLVSLVKKPILKLTRGKAIVLLAFSILFGFVAIYGLVGKSEIKKTEKAKVRQQEIIKEAYVLIEENNLFGAEAKLQEATDLIKKTKTKPEGIEKAQNAIKLIKGGEKTKEIAQEVFKNMNLDELSSLKKNGVIPLRFQLGSERANEKLVGLLSPLLNYEIRKKERQAKEEAIEIKKRAKEEAIERERQAKEEAKIRDEEEARRQLETIDLVLLSWHWSEDYGYATAMEVEEEIFYL